MAGRVILFAPTHDLLATRALGWLEQQAMEPATGADRHWVRGSVEAYTVELRDCTPGLDGGTLTGDEEPAL